MVQIYQQHQEAPPPTSSALAATSCARSCSHFPAWPHMLLPPPPPLPLVPMLLLYGMLLLYAPRRRVDPNHRRCGGLEFASAPACGCDRGCGKGVQVDVSEVVLQRGVWGAGPVSSQRSSCPNKSAMRPNGRGGAGELVDGSLKSSTQLI
jgi:hypothetical protein